MVSDVTLAWGAPGFDPDGAVDTDGDPQAVSTYFQYLVPREYSTVAGLLAATPPGNGYAARALNAPGAWFIRTGGAWVMHGIARFADASARSTAIASPVQGMLSKRDNYHSVEQYWAAYDAGTNPTSPLKVAGWQALVPTARFKGSITTSKSVATTNYWGHSSGPTFDVTDDPQSGFAAGTGLYTCQIGGTYLVTAQQKNNGTGVANMGFGLYKNGTLIGQSPNAASQAFGGNAFTQYVRLLPGDTISIKALATYTSQSDGAAVDNNYLELVQISF